MNRKRKPERMYSETTIINEGKFNIVKCAEFGNLEDVKEIEGKQLGKKFCTEKQKQQNGKLSKMCWRTAQKTKKVGGDAYKCQDRKYA